MLFHHRQAQSDRATSCPWFIGVAVFFALVLIAGAVFARVTTRTDVLNASQIDIFDRLVEQCEERAEKLAQKERAERGLFNFPGSLTASKNRTGWLKYTAPDNRFSVEFPSKTWTITPGIALCGTDCDRIGLDLYPAGHLEDELPWSPAIQIRWDKNIGNDHINPKQKTEFARRPAVVTRHFAWTIFGPATGRTIFIESENIHIETLDRLGEDVNVINAAYGVSDDHYNQEIDEVLETFTFD